MSEIKRYSDLVVWQKAMDLTVDIYKITKTFPTEEKYGLVSQMQRSAVSIPSNIAEGFERVGTKSYIQFLSIANGSRAELLTQLEICERLGYINDISKFRESLEEIGKMLVIMIRNLTNK